MEAITHGQRLYTTAQIATASVIGGPLPACWLIGHNFDVLGQPQRRRRWIAGGAVSMLILLVLVMSIPPQHMPHYIIPLAYSVGLREWARKMQGSAIDSHRSAGGRIGSWWLVVGFGLAGIISFFALLFLVLLLFPSIGPQ